ncbi:MAG TPA: DMT family transporter [Thermoanaerobaculia bacterium]|nr:DMT family transporter [Thermoanaerobaculia bacterium]
MVAAAALLWSTGGIAIKAAPEPALVVAFYRSTFAAGALAIFLRPRLRRLTLTFVVALVSYAACLTTFVIATKWTTAANAIFLQYSGVVWVLLASPLITKDPLHLRDAAAVVVALAGMALFFVGKLHAGSAGDLVAVASGVFFASLVLSLRLERGAGAEAAVTYGNVLAAVCLLPFVFDRLALSGRSAAILLFLGIVQLALAYALFVRGLQHVTATRASLIGMLEPICNPIWVFLFLGERPGVFAILGGTIVLAAVAWRTFGAAAPVSAKVAPPD